MDDGSAEAAGSDDEAGTVNEAAAAGVLDARLSAAFRQAPVGMAVTTTDGSFVEVNDALCELLGRSREELTRLFLDDVTHVEDVEEVRDARRRMLYSGERRVADRLRLLRADQRPVPVSLSCAVLREPGDDVQGLVLLAADASAAARRESELAHRALHDPLTGLANRVLFLDRLTHALARLRRGESSVAVLFIDIDDFKDVNDRHGHSVGDAVLAQAASRLSAAVRPGDTVARFGGDEFVVLCEDSGPSEAATVARRVEERWKAGVDVPQGRIRLACSIGIAVAQSADASAEQLLGDADAAMYREKARR